MSGAGGSGKGQNYSQKWKLDLSARSGGIREVSAISRSTELSNPPGYATGAVAAHHVAESGSRDSDEQLRLLTKRAWELALGPLKQIPMNFFIMYMAGSSISIFPIMMVGMFFLRPAKALVSVGSTFKALEDELDSMLIPQRLVYMLGHLCGVGIAVYKCSSMGLLPTHASDWLDFLDPPQRIEFATGSFVYS